MQQTTAKSPNSKCQSIYRKCAPSLLRTTIELAVLLIAQEIVCNHNIEALHGRKGLVIRQ
jgi:hypothetical protein